MSLHIRQLEERTGHRLLERVGKRAFATKAGEVLLGHAVRALSELEAAGQALQRLRGVVAGRLRLGTGATASTYLLPPLLRRLRARYPALELVVVTGNSAEIAAAVAGNHLDLGVVTLPVSRVRWRCLRSTWIDSSPSRRPDRAWRGRRSITASELATHPLILYERGGTIRRVIDDWFRRSRATPRVAMELGNNEAIKKLVEAGLGLSVSSTMAVKAEVRAGTLVAMALEPPLSRRLAIVSRRDKPESPALSVLLSGLSRLRASHVSARRVS